jgi:broad specificity phosphatase PhoE
VCIHRSWGSQILLKKPTEKQENAVGVTHDSDDNEDAEAEAASPGGFSVKLYLPVGTHFFRFCVDGNWVYDPEVVFAGDEYGNLNNFIRVFPHVNTATGVKRVQLPVRTMIRDSANGLPLMNPHASEEINKLRAQQHQSGIRRSPRAATHAHQSMSDPLPLLTSLRAPQETQDLEYDLDVNGPRSGTTAATTHAVAASGARSRSGTLTRSHSDESLLGHGHDTVVVTPKYVNHVNDGASASVLLAATTQHFGGDLVTKEHEQRAQRGGHRSSLVTGKQTTPSTRRGGKLMIFLVGLPGRGKTFIAHTLARHMTWMGHQSKIFNTGEYRRRLVGATVGHDFWDPQNAESAEIRTAIARQCLDDSIAALERDDCDCAIFDATNATRNRRRMLADELTKRSKCELLFIESVYNQADMISASVNEMKLHSADYAARTLEETEQDYGRRIQHYVAVYEPMDAAREKLSFIQVTDIGRQLFCNQVYGYLQSRIMFLMANLNLKPRPIWLSRHGESMYNTQKRIGGDAPLSPLGVQYAMQLDRFVETYYPAQTTELAVWTSTMLRTGMTVERIAARGRTIVKWKQLDEIDAGVCDGMTYEQVATDMPDEYVARKHNKLHYRYPRGESYQDVIHRLEPVITELMRIDKPVLIVAHQAILRVLYAYLTNKAPAECPTLNIPLHVVIQVTPKAYRCEEVWHRPM